MKINIQIEDASPEELQRIFAPQQNPRVAIAPSEGKVIMASVPVEQGAGKAAKSGDTSHPSQKKLKKPTAPSKKYKGGDQGADRWSNAEHKALDDNLDDFEKAWAEYQRVAPDSKRGKSGVRQRWALRSRRKKNDGKIQPAAKNVAKRSEGADIKIQGIDKDLEAAMPEKRPPTRGDPPKDITSGSPAGMSGTASSPSPHPTSVTEFKIGMHVKQVRPYLNRTVSGIGAVTALVKGLVEVNFGGQQYYKIAPDCLEVI
jgi:hypothetical protein